MGLPCSECIFFASHFLFNLIKPSPHAQGFIQSEELLVYCPQACLRVHAESAASCMQEFNKGIFDYLIATDDPAKRLEQQEADAEEPAPQQKAAPTASKGRGRDKNSRNRKRGAEADSEFGVIRGIDFQGVRTVVNVDVPESVQVSIFT